MAGEKHFTKKRSAGYFNQLLSSDPMKLMRKYSVCPSNDIGGYKGKKLWNMDVSAYGRNASMAYAGVMRERHVGYIDLYKEPRAAVAHVGGVTNNEGGDVIKFNCSYSAANGGVPVYFLPWDSGGAIIRITIPNKGQNPVDPDIFFTAAINGCSVFIQGQPDNPTIYHAGGDTEKPDANDAANFWRTALVREILRNPLTPNRGHVTAEVNKTEYVKTPGIAGGTTARAAQFEAWLKAKLDKTGKFTVTMVNPWGCVMGIRTGNDWKFYLQENATVVCNHVTKAGVDVRYYARPMALKEIYPGGATHAADMRFKVPLKIT